MFEDSGDGPLVVLLHGFPDTPAGWEETRAALNAAGYRTVAPYLRGYHPETIVPGRRYRGADLGQDGANLLRALGGEPAVLVGHDWGAAVAYRTATSAPEMLRGLCGVAIPHPRALRRSPGLLWKGRHFITLSLPTGPWLARRENFAYIDVLMRRWAPNWSGPGRERTLADVREAFSDPKVLDGALSYYRDSSPSWNEPPIATPTLIVGGATDIIGEEAFMRSPPFFTGRCDVAIAPGAGHWPHREAPEFFQERLLSFLGSLPRAEAQSG